MISVEVFVVFAVAALDLAIMPWREWFYQLVPNTHFSQRPLKKCFLVAAVAIQPIGEL